MWCEVSLNIRNWYSNRRPCWTFSGAGPRNPPLLCGPVHCSLITPAYEVVTLDPSIKQGINIPYQDLDNLPRHFATHFTIRSTNSNKKSPVSQIWGSDYSPAIFAMPDSVQEAKEAQAREVFKIIKEMSALLVRFLDPQKSDPELIWTVEHSPH